MVNAEMQLERIVVAREALQDARKMKCTCSSFQLQYEGCYCDKGVTVGKAKIELQSLIDALQVPTVDKDKFVTNKEGNAKYKNETCRRLYYLCNFR